MAGYVDTIYTQAGMWRDESGWWPAKMKFETITENIYAGTFLQELIAEYAAKLTALGFTIPEPNDNGYYPDGISVDFRSPIDENFVGIIYIGDESITISIFVDDIEDNFTIDQFIESYPWYVLKLPAQKLQVFDILPQPIAEEIAEYYMAALIRIGH